MKRQKHKGKKRPRSWHRRSSAQHHYWCAVQKSNRMFERVEREAA